MFPSEASTTYQSRYYRGEGNVLPDREKLALPVDPEMARRATRSDRLYDERSVSVLAFLARLARLARHMV
jgi:hypothetical protein